MFIYACVYVRNWRDVYMYIYICVGRNLSIGVVSNVILQKVSFCTDLFLDTLYRKCITFDLKKGPPCYAP